jgi:hypothetical protein
MRRHKKAAGLLLRRPIANRPLRDEKALQRLRAWCRLPRALRALANKANGQRGLASPIT